MTNVERAAGLARALSLLVDAYTIPAWTSAQLDLYQEMLFDLDPAEVRAVIVDWIKRSPSRPTIADLRTKIDRSSPPFVC